jgi:hypothetical protein
VNIEFHIIVLDQLADHRLVRVFFRVGEEINSGHIFRCVEGRFIMMLQLASLPPFQMADELISSMATRSMPSPAAEGNLTAARHKRETA